MWILRRQYDTQWPEFLESLPVNYNVSLICVTGHIHIQVQLETKKLRKGSEIMVVEHEPIIGNRVGLVVSLIKEQTKNERYGLRWRHVHNQRNFYWVENHKPHNMTQHDNIRFQFFNLFLYLMETQGPRTEEEIYRFIGRYK